MENQDNEQAAEQPVESASNQTAEAPNQTKFSATEVQGIVNAAVEAALKQFQNSVSNRSNEYNETLIKHVANAQSNLITPKEVQTKEQKVGYVKKVVEEDSLRRRMSADGTNKYGQAGEDFLKAKIMLLKSTGDYTDEQIAEYLLDE